MCGSVGTNQCCCVGVCSLHCYLNLLIVTSTCSDLPVVCNNPAHLHLINKQCVHLKTKEITLLYSTETRAGNFNQGTKKKGEIELKYAETGAKGSQKAACDVKKCISIFGYGLNVPHVLGLFQTYWI